MTQIFLRKTGTLATLDPARNIHHSVDLISTLNRYEHTGADMSSKFSKATRVPYARYDVKHSEPFFATTLHTRTNLRLPFSSAPWPHPTLNRRCKSPLMPDEREQRRIRIWDGEAVAHRAFVPPRSRVRRLTSPTRRHLTSRHEATSPAGTPPKAGFGGFEFRCQR